jgi:hypothetical protein
LLIVISGGSARTHLNFTAATTPRKIVRSRDPTTTVARMSGHSRAADMQIKIAKADPQVTADSWFGVHFFDPGMYRLPVSRRDLDDLRQSFGAATAAVGMTMPLPN